MQQLLNPFAQKYPEAVDSTLSSQATTVRFNPSGPFAGHYLAAGGSDGLIEIWDVETRGIVRIFEGHVKAIGGLSWSRNNRYLLSASLDSTAIVWDLSILPSALLQPSTPARSTSTSRAASSSARVRTIRFDAPLASAQFHPRNSKIILATLTCNEVILVDLRLGGGRYRLDDVMEGDGERDEEGTRVGSKPSSLACASFSPCGSRIYAGTTAGVVLIIDPLRRLVISRIRVGNSAIRQIAFDSSGHNLILSSSDRALRVLVVSPLTGELAPIHRFQDLVNRTPWHAIGFSGDAEYVMGGAGHKMAHNVFIWDREAGALVKVLEGPKEPLIDCDWHPTRPVIASVANSGDIHIWQTSSSDNWAAFAPGFEELEENVEYDEREDEFDIEDEGDLARRKDAEEDLIIDVLSPQDDYPRRPDPATLSFLMLGTSQGEEEEAIRDIEARAAQLVKSIEEWSAGEPDSDDWEGFYISLDLLDQLAAEEGAN